MLLYKNMDRAIVNMILQKPIDLTIVGELNIFNLGMMNPVDVYILKLRTKAALYSIRVNIGQKSAR
jgi:hypothetical protein